MDRPIVYPGALPQDTDILNTNLFGMIAQAFLNAAVIGNTTAVSGLSCTPTAPASLTVNVGVGSIYALDEIDASAYGSLGSNTNTIVKQGILSTAVALQITPPGTAGYSQNYLVQAALQDFDGGAQVLSFYNSANPAQPFSGPNNSGASSMTMRQCKCIVSLKAGSPATTGTQVTPTPDAGFIGLYTITIANGATQIAQNNISQLGTAPFFPTLPQVPTQVQQGIYVYAGQDTGAANAYVVTFAPGQPIPLAYVAGMKVIFKALNPCTGASTVNVNGLGNVPIRRASGVALATGDIVSGGVVELTYDGTNFQMANYLGSGATSNTTTSVNIPFVVDSGTQNQIVATYSPAITSGQQVKGLTIEVQLANTITGGCTINVNGLGAKNVTLGDGTTPPYNIFVAGEVLLLIYDGTQYQIAGTSAGMFYRKPTANYTIYVNAATGSDTAYDGTSATVTGVGTAGPLKTIQAAVNTAFGYAPSIYTITIQVAAGTYNEAVLTPGFAGPSLVINGAGAGSTFVTGANNAHTFSIVSSNTVIIKNLHVSTGTGSGPPCCFSASAGGTISTNNTASGFCAYSIWEAYGPSNVSAGSHTFDAGSSTQIIWGAFFGGFVSLAQNATFAFSGSFTIGAAAAAVSYNGSIAVPVPGAPTFSGGTITGMKFTASYNGTIATQGSGVNYFPGSVAGVAYTASGGQYA